METHFYDRLRSFDRDRRWSQKIENARTNVLKTSLKDTEVGIVLIPGLSLIYDNLHQIMALTTHDKSPKYALPLYVISTDHSFRRLRAESNNREITKLHLDSSFCISCTEIHNLPSYWTMQLTRLEYPGF